jgi:Ca-activated chloride channel homolog
MTKIKRHINLAFIFLCLTALSGVAQNPKKLLREGNKAYLANKNYKKAEDLYKRALAADNKYNKAAYNLGAAYFKQGKFEEAAAQFEGIKNITKHKDSLSSGLYNQGTSYIKAKKYDEAIKSLKQSIKLNPKDEDAKYNLAYALTQKKKQEQKQQQQKQNQQQQQKQQQGQKKPEEKKQQEQNISKKEAERMLNALNQEEKKLQRKKKKMDDKTSNAFSGKDW